MCEIQDYLKSLNPKQEEQTILMYGSEYHLWRDGSYLGIATWTQDENVGDSFQESVLDEETGLIIQHVFIADKWELKIKNQ
jgi:hypothetical protein